MRMIPENGTASRYEATNGIIKQSTICWRAG